jgi:hypothetical protein
LAEAGLSLVILGFAGAGTTVKLATLAAAPPGVVTLSAPHFVAAGALHLICVALHETHLVHFLLPNFTELVPCAAPKLALVMVTVASRLAEEGVSLVMPGAAEKPRFVVARMAPLLATARPGD